MFALLTPKQHSFSELPRIKPGIIGPENVRMS